MLRMLVILFMLCSGGWMASSNCGAEELAGIPWTGKFPVFTIGHRGFSGAAPENTLASFKKAIELGADMIEFDVLLSKDGQVVVIHDDTLNRTTNGTGKVSDHILEELKQLSAGSRFGSQFFGETIPTLKEVLELTRGKIVLHIELKQGDLGKYTMVDLADRSFDEVEKAGMLNQVLFGSFDLSAIDRIRQRNPKLPVALIYNKAWNAPQDAFGQRPIPVLSSSGTFLKEDNMARAHQAGVKVFVWTVNMEEQIEHVLNLKVDGIISNYPDRVIKILQKRFK